jgi:hypothetical protein
MRDAASIARRTIAHAPHAPETLAMTAVPTSRSVRLSALATLTAALFVHGAALAQGNANPRSTPGQARDASTPGRAPATPSTAGRSSDQRSTPGASTESRSTDGRTGTDTRSSSRERPEDQRSRTAPK